MNRRYSSEKKQETISRTQLAEFLDQYEWIMTDIDPDLGEDILIRIYEEGRSTGISFYIQLKSTDDIEKYRLKSGVISYQFQVKDLLHWENQVIPVLIVVWDVSQKIGWWAWVSKAIKVLDEKNSTWRKQSSKQVHIEYENTLSSNSLKRIRFYLANYFFSLIAKEKPLDIQTQFMFPKTEEGKAKFDEAERSFNKGDKLELEKEYISNIQFPDWVERLFGKEMFDDHQKIRLEPIEDKEPKPARIDFISDNYGLESIPYVDFRIEKEGQEEVTLSNIEQKIPYKITLKINKVTGQFHFNIRTTFSNLDAFEARSTFNIRNVLSSGGELRLKMLETGDSIINSFPKGMVEKPSDFEIEFVDNLCFIQEAFGEPIVFPEDGSFTPNDVIEAKNLVEIVRSGVIEYSGNNFTVDIYKSGIEQIFQIIQEKEQIRFRLEWEEYSKKLLTSELSLGSMIQYIKGDINKNKSELKRWLDDADEEDSLEIIMEKVKVREEYHRWIKDDTK